MLESSHPTLPPNNSAPDMQQAVIADFKPTPRPSAWSCLLRKSQIRASPLRHYNNHKPEGSGIPLTVPTNKKHGKTLTLTDITSPTTDGDCFPQKNSKTSHYGLHNAHFIPKKPQNEKATYESTKQAERRKWGIVRKKRAYQKNVC